MLKLLDSRTKFYEALKNRQYFCWRQALAILQICFFRSEGKIFSLVILFKLLTSIILFCRKHRCCVHALFVVNLKGTDVTYLCKMLIYFYFIFFLFLKPHVGTDLRVLRLFIIPFNCFYFFLSSGIEYRTLCQTCGKLYLPMFLFRVRLLTLI